MNTAINVWLETCLAPISPFLAADDITDVWINRPKEVWIERLGGGIERYAIPDLDRPLLLRMARQIAALTSQGINRENPILSGALPTGERVQVVIPPATRGDVAIAIRKHVMSGKALEDYRSSNATDQPAAPKGTDATNTIEAVSRSGDPVDMLRNAVRSQQNILISGGTSSGKTTFLNALLREIPQNERLILIEDTPELQVTHANSVGLLSPRSSLGEAGVSAEDLLISALRMRPDRIILGEIRGNEATAFLRAVNTGHPGSITTIHADSPERAIDQLALMVLQTGVRMTWDDVVTYVRRSLGFIVQLKRTEHGRQISAFFENTGLQV